MLNTHIKNRGLTQTLVRNNNKNQINITSTIVMAGEIGDSLIITKSNHIELYGNIIEIESI